MCSCERVFSCGRRRRPGPPTEPMRVAHLTTVDLSLRFLLFPQLRAVVDEGGEAIGISAPGPWVEGLERDGIRHVALPSSTRGVDPLGDLRAAIELWRVLRRERPDVLHTHNPKPGLYGRVVGRLAGVPIVVNTVHGLYATERDRWWKRVAVYLLESIASRFSDAELVQNPEDLALLLRFHLAPRRSLRLLGNGVDVARFDPSAFTSDDRVRSRRAMGVGEDEILVGSVGRLVAEKGYPELFEAMQRLDRRYRLVVVGAEDPEKPDALPAEMLSAARDRGVVFLGHRDDIEGCYAAMDLFVLASHREGFPRAAMEASAMGLPVVATDIRGCRQVVDDGVNGRLVPVTDPAVLAGVIRALGDDEATRLSMSSKARAIALERFDERHVVEIVLATYEEVAERKGLVLG